MNEPLKKSFCNKLSDTLFDYFLRPGNFLYDRFSVLMLSITTLFWL